MNRPTTTRAYAACLLQAASLTALGVAAAPSAAMAQQAGPAQVDRVVVTGRRREESFVEIPASVTAFTQAEIESADIETARDYIKLTPNVTLVETQNSGTAFVTIRGISQARNSEPSVAVIIDGVQQTNPSQFTQQLVNIEQIEVLRGPQGAIYGRNAIGGAINITTRGPTDVWETTVETEIDTGFGYELGGRVSGPLGENLGFSGGLRWRDTEGYIENEFLDEKADPVENLAGRARFVLDATPNLSFDLRGSFDMLDGRALYYVIDSDADNTSIPVRVNNRGTNERDIYNLSLQAEYETDFGTLTSTTAWDSLEEILTGDQFDFKPITESFYFGLLNEDWNQSQYLDVENISQEIRFTSPDDRAVRYIAGAYAVWTERFISTGNMADTGAGVFPIYREPSTDPANPQRTFLADSQDNFAWAVFGDVSVDLAQDWELSVAARYDEDEREQTTLTPPAFLTALPSATTGEVRTRTFSEFQPKVTLRYSPTADWSLYGSYSRGFRSGGFNQSGVGFAAANNPAYLGGPILGVDDVFDAEVADTWEAGFKSVLMGGDLRLNGAAYYTETENSYFFVFLSSNSTQNLGNIDQVEYMGFELDGSWRLTDSLTANFGFGYTDSEITDFADPTVEGNQAPLVSEYTLNLGLQYLQPVSDELNFVFRTDYQVIGPTWWEPYNTTARNPVHLVDIRAGIEGDDWRFTAWAKNAFDEDYNAEFSPGGFLFPALPARYGLELTRTF